METGVVRGVGSTAIRLIGSLEIRRSGIVPALPASRKVRALAGYLAIAARPVTRAALCEFLWDGPSDPRGELRWCLSKLRAALDEPGRVRLQARGDTIHLDRSNCFVDALEIAEAMPAIETSTFARLRGLAGLFAGSFLEGLDLDDGPAGAWLDAQRRRFASYHVSLLAGLVAKAPDDDAGLEFAERWLALAPFDLRAHQVMFDAFARRNQIREGERHLERAAGSFENDGLDPLPLHAAWRSARLRPAVASALPSLQTPAVDVPASGSARRASIAVMPFSDRSAVAAARGGTADALAHDIITRLAKLRSAFVIAQGTMFALQERALGAAEAARLLDVDFVTSGSVVRHERRITVSVELAEVRTGRVVWAETFDRACDDAFAVLDEIGNVIVASIASEIEASERNRAILRPPNSLDAWEAHHRGLWHMYRFTTEDNATARHFFEMAVRLDPTFARAYAALSFTHFQNAFQGWTDRATEIERAYAAAVQSLLADDRDPAAHWAMGRALWLRGRFADSLGELEQSVHLSPNFALGHYTLAFVHSQTGDPEAALASSDHSRSLSPFDPLLFGMLGARAMALVRLGRFEEAADFGVKAAARPNAHAHILAIAALSTSLAGRLDAARDYVATIRKTLPGYGVADFLTAMQFEDDGRRLFRTGAKTIGLE